MSSAIHAAPVGLSAANARHFLLRRLHSLTGIVFGLYIVIHLLVNATLIEGQKPRDIFWLQVEKIHSLPFLLAVEWALIYLPILFHTIYGIWITFAGVPNVQNYPYAKNWFYTLQRVSAMIIVGFLVFHVLGMKGWFGQSLAFRPNAEGAFRSTVEHINLHWVITWVVYPLGVLASTFHLANGFWTAGISWGLTVSKAGQRRWGWVCAALFAFTFGCGMAAWIAAVVYRSEVGIK